MNEKRLAVLALFDERTSDALAGLYGTLRQNGFKGTQTKDIPYHFTLAMDGREREGELLRLLGEAEGRTRVIEFRMDHIGLFSSGVLFAEPNVNAELLELQSVFSPEPPRGYHLWAAHATILIDGPETVLRALPLVLGSFAPMPSRVERLALYEFFPPKPLRTVTLRP